VLVGNNNGSTGNISTNKSSNSSGKNKNNLKQLLPIQSQITSPITEKYLVRDINKKYLFIFSNEQNFNEIDFDEKSQLYLEINTILDNFFKSGLLLPKMVIICTQNSVSCIKGHFQHMVSNIILEITKKSTGKYDYRHGIRLISKADATASENTGLSCVKHKYNKMNPFNCRIRIYCNKYIYSKEYKENKGKIIRGQKYKSSISPYNPNQNYKYNSSINLRNHDFAKEENNRMRKTIIYVKKCEKNIINLNKDGVGRILYDIILGQGDEDIQRFIVCNSNLPTFNSDNILSNLNTKLFNHNRQCPINFVMVTPDSLRISIINPKNTIKNIKKLL
jgi:hypothetical protein